MPMSDARIELVPEQFAPKEVVLVRFAGLEATGFRYASGVAGLRIRNGAGEVTLLPFQGQQIWRAGFFGRELTMRSMFDEPVPTRDYLSTYGAFFLHCGAAAMGNPGPDDTHALHGELPNAPFGDAQLVLGEDGEGPFMALTGHYRSTVAFSHDYVARPTVRLHLNSARIVLDMDIENLKRTPMDLMYLAHINFRPVDAGRLVDTVRNDRTDIRVRTNLPPFFTPSDSYLRFRDAVVADPARHRTMSPGVAIDPELVLAMRPAGDTDGWAHALQVHPDGTADFVSHRPDELGHGVRWIVRSPDLDALGLMLPATAEADGYTAEKAKGNVLQIAPGAHFRCEMRFGALEAREAAAMEHHITEAQADVTHR